MAGHESSPDPTLVGAGPRQAAARLLAAFEEVGRRGARPRMVTLEAPVGWGKTRIVQALYAGLASRQSTPRYWPPSLVPDPAGEAIGVHDARKRIYPTRMQPPRRATPEFLWWGITATRRQVGGAAVQVLADDVTQITAHRRALERRSRRELGTLRGLWFALRRRFALRSLLATVGGEAASAAVATAGTVLAGPAAIAAGFAVERLIVAMARLRTRGGGSGGLDPTGGSRPDLVGPIAAHLIDIARAGVPLVIAVEDLHAADDSLVDLLLQLLTGPAAPILVVATAWPGLLEEDARPASRLLREVPRASLERLTRTDRPALAADELADVALAAAPDLDPVSARLLADHFSNPLCVVLSTRLRRVRRAIAAGTLPADLRAMPHDVDGMFRMAWGELPEDLRSALTLAALSTPAGVDAAGSPRRGSTVWDTDVVVAAAAGMEWLAGQVDGLRGRLADEAVSYEWAQVVEGGLHAFPESAQFEIALAGRDDLLSEKELDLYRRQLVRTLDVVGGSHVRRIAAAELLWVLSEHGLAATTEAVVAAGGLLVEELGLRHGVESSRRLVGIVERLPGGIEGPAVRRRRLRHLALARMGRLEDALAAARGLLRDVAAVGGVDDEVVLKLRADVVGLCADVGLISEALREGTRLLADWRASRPGDTANIAGLRQNLATFRAMSGDASGAASELRLLLEDPVLMAALDSVDALTVRRNLAAAMGDSGDVTGAVAALEHLLGDCMATLGPQHPTTLSVKEGIADRRRELGDPAAAADLHVEILVAREQALGPDHPDTLAARLAIAQCRGELGGPEALEAVRRVVTDLTETLGPTHRGTIDARRALVARMVAGGDLDGGLADLEAIHRELIGALGAEHPTILDVRAERAELRARLGRSDAALRDLEDIHAARERLSGSSHPRTLDALERLLHLRGTVGEAQRAVEGFTGLVARLRDVLGPDHPRALRARSHLAHWTGTAGDHDAAIRGFEALQADRTRVLGPDHPDTLRATANLASWLGQSGRLEDALESYLSVAESRARILGGDHPEVLDTRQRVAVVQALLGDLVGASQTLEALLEARLRVLGPEHPDVAATRELIVDVLARIDDAGPGDDRSSR